MLTEDHSFDNLNTIQRNKTFISHHIKTNTNINKINTYSNNNKHNFEIDKQQIKTDIMNSL